MRLGNARGGLAVVLLMCLTCLMGLMGLMGLTAGAAAAASAQEDRVIRDGRITESSGLAASLRHPGVVWTNNDSGHSARVFAIAKDGTTASTVTVRGEDARDWEAITSVRVPPDSGRPYIAVGDIGDNNYEYNTSRIIVLPEPENLTTQRIRPQRVIRFRYPGGPRNAEALLADPRSGQFLVVTKDFLSSQIYAVPTSVWPDRTSGVSDVVTLELVASSTASLVTDGSFLPDGRILLRNYGRIYLLDKPEDVEDGKLRPLKSASLPDQEQGESLTVEDRGAVALIGTEGERSPVLRLDLKEYGMASGTPPERSQAEAAPEASPDAAGENGRTTADESSPERSTWVVVGVGAVAVVLLVAGTVTLVSRRH